MNLSVLVFAALTGCSSQSWNCANYGVVQSFAPMGALAAINELPDSEVERVCGLDHVGCVIQSVDTVRIYYRTGDECAFRHELCHVMHGAAHTDKYNADLSPRRVCP